jgi:hypothetical protein
MDGKLATKRLAQAGGNGKGKPCRQVFLQLKGGNGDLEERLMSIWRRQRIPIYNRDGDCVAEIRFFREGETRSASSGISRAFVSMTES